MAQGISKKSRVQCQWCENECDAETWNSITYAECSSREMKRAFKAIYDRQVWGKDSQHFYKCPHCGTWSQGNQLKMLDSNGDEVKGMGGRAVIKFTN